MVNILTNLFFLDIFVNFRSASFRLFVPYLYSIFSSFFSFGEQNCYNRSLGGPGRSKHQLDQIKIKTLEIKFHSANLVEKSEKPGWIFSTKQVDFTLQDCQMMPVWPDFSVKTNSKRSSKVAQTSRLVYRQLEKCHCESRLPCYYRTNLKSNEMSSVQQN